MPAESEFMKRFFKIFGLLIVICLVVLGAELWRKYAQTPGYVTNHPAQNDYSIVYFTKRNFLGEDEYLRRVLRIAEDHNAKIRVAYFDKNKTWRFFVTTLVKWIKPDFVVGILGDHPVIPEALNYTVLSHGVYSYFNEEGIANNHTYLRSMDGFLLSFDNRQPFDLWFDAHAKPDAWADEHYPLSLAAPYTDSPKRILHYSGANWDSLRNSQRYHEFYQMLVGAGYFEVYGPESSWRFLEGDAYKGFLPADNHSYMETLRQAGIALVLHSKGHLEGDALSGRVFEAATAGCVIISDMHPSVRRVFGDTVLYIDHTASAEEMFKQVDAHMRFILENPEEADRLARRSHAIVQERYTLEKQFERMLRLYNAQKKARSKSSQL